MKPATVVMRDPLLPHQIVIGTRWVAVMGRSWLYVSCNCRHVAGDVYEPLMVQELFEPGEAAAVWHRHMARVGAA